MYDKKCISVTSHTLDPSLLSQTVTLSRTPPPSSVTYFMDFTYFMDIEELVREAADDWEDGIEVGGKWIKALRFARYLRPESPDDYCKKPGNAAMWIWRRMETINWTKHND